MKLIFIFCLITFCSAILNGRLDTFDDVGYLTPKNSFKINDNIYFRTYFEYESEDNIKNINLNKFSVDLWNGTNILFFNNGNYTDFATIVNLIIGDPNNILDINIVLNINPDIFSIEIEKSRNINFKANYNVINNEGIFTTFQTGSLIKVSNLDEDSEQSNANINGFPYILILLLSIYYFL